MTLASLPFLGAASHAVKRTGTTRKAYGLSSSSGQKPRTSGRYFGRAVPTRAIPVREKVRSAWAPSAQSDAGLYSVANTATESLEAPEASRIDDSVIDPTPKIKFSMTSISEIVG